MKKQMLSREEILAILEGYLGKVTESRLMDKCPEGTIYYMREPIDKDALWFYWADHWDQGLVSQMVLMGGRLVIVDGISGEILFDGISGD